MNIYEAQEIAAKYRARSISDARLSRVPFPLEQFKKDWRDWLQSTCAIREEMQGMTKRYLSGNSACCWGLNKTAIIDMHMDQTQRAFANCAGCDGHDTTIIDTHISLLKEEAC